MTRHLKTALSLLLALTLLVVGYTLCVTGLAQVLFPHAANASLVWKRGVVVGSERIGQTWSDPKWFWGRPSATSPSTNAVASAGSNLGPLNPALAEAVAARVAALRASDRDNADPVPVDLVTASASGLDPDISPAAARWQAGRVARLRGLPRERVLALIDRMTEGRTFGLLGEPRVNVLRLNLALEDLR